MHPKTPVEATRRAPRAHQQEALDGISAELANHDRATAVMACGTGKTLVALWQTERLNPQRVVVFVPSLALLRQTLLEWTENTSWGKRFRYLCVCSDPKVSENTGGDDILAENVGFPVMTNPALVGSFLQLAPRADSVSVVFCTYQSAGIIGQAIAPLGARGGFDVGVFDESHKTTGDKEGLFGFALRDKNIAIKKRLFLTATPKHYKLGRRDADGEFPVVSMDDAAVYGRVAYRLGFAEAAARGIIVPYKIIISVVDSSMVDNAILEKSQVLLDDTPVDARTTAHQLALKHAINEHDLRRVITFHSRVATAAAFAAAGPGGVGSHLPGFQTFHVSGKNGASERDAQIQAFSAAAHGIITNARCLTEGVDVPSVDMVALIDPRTSAIDIAQTAGRAMRPSPGKKFGYVMVPLFVESRSGESVEDAIARSGFSEVIQVLNGMREADDQFALEIRQAATDLGHLGTETRLLLNTKVEIIGPLLKIADLKKAVSTRIIEEIGLTWDARLGQLRRFKERFGTTDYSSIISVDTQLATWLNNQKALYNKQQLSADRIERLEKVGIEWDSLKARWDDMIRRMLKFKSLTGHCNLPHKYPADPALFVWMRSTRQGFSVGRLTAEKITQLTEIGFELSPTSYFWRVMLGKLKDFVSQNGHCHVPYYYDADQKLSDWVKKLRIRRNRNHLSGEEISQLDMLGFIWDSSVHRQLETDAAWMPEFEKLKTYFYIHGTSDIPQKYSVDRALAIWVTKQRKLYKKDILSVAQIAALRELQFSFDPKTDNWNRMFRRLAEFKLNNDGIEPRFEYSSEKELYTWCRSQRQVFKAGRMNSECQGALNSINFKWNPVEIGWNSMLDRLKEFKCEYGHLAPSQTTDIRLFTFLVRTRSLARTGRLAKDRIAVLSALGIEWDPIVERWDAFATRLNEYVQKNGHCRVRQSEDTELSRWLRRQRQKATSGQLEPTYISRLQLIHPEWLGVNKQKSQETTAQRTDFRDHQ